MRLLPHLRPSKPKDINPYNSQRQTGRMASGGWKLFPCFTDQDTEEQEAPKMLGWNNINSRQCGNKHILYELSLPQLYVC